MLIPAVVFGLVLIIVFGAYWVVVVRPEEHEEQVLRTRLKPRRLGSLGPAIARTRENLSSVELFDTLLERYRSLINPLRQLITRSGVRVTVGAAILSILLLFTVVFFVVSTIATSLWAGVVGGAVVGAVPILYLRYRANKRLALFEEQFPETMDLIARALRAGHALPTALQLAGNEIPDPVGAEFKLLFEQQNYGMSLNDALKAMADRMPLLDARFFVTALLTQREMGGNLAEVLDSLAAVIRERFKVKRQVRVVSAHGRLTGFILAVLPPVVAGVLFVISPAQVKLLVNDSLGLDMLLTAIVLQVVGLLIIRRIVNVEY